MDALNMLQRMEDGYFIEELGELITDVSDAVRKSGKGAKGKVTVTIDIVNQGDIGATVNARMSHALPARPSRGSFFFVHGGELHAYDPRRPELPAFRAVPEEQPIVRTATEAQAVREATQ